MRLDPLTNWHRFPARLANAILRGVADLNRPVHRFLFDRLRMFLLLRIVPETNFLALAATLLVELVEARAITHPRLPHRETAMVPLFAARGLPAMALPEPRMTLQTTTTLVVIVAEVVAAEAGGT